MNKLKNFIRIKMFVAILLSYGIVAFGSPQVFIANTPQFRPDFIARLRATPQTVYAFARYPFNNQERVNIIETAQSGNNKDKENLPYQSIAPGVYAAEDPETKERYIKIEDGTQVEIRYVTFSDGRKVKVYIPVSQ